MPDPKIDVAAYKPHGHSEEEYKKARGYKACPVCLALALNNTETRLTEAMAGAKMWEEQFDRVLGTDKQKYEEIKHLRIQAEESRARIKELEARERGRRRRMKQKPAKQKIQARDSRPKSFCPHDPRGPE